MYQHAKRQVHKMRGFRMFITAVCAIFLIKNRLAQTVALLYYVFQNRSYCEDNFGRIAVMRI